MEGIGKKGKRKGAIITGMLLPHKTWQNEQVFPLALFITATNESWWLFWSFIMILFILIWLIYKIRRIKGRYRHMLRRKHVLIREWIFIC